MNPAENYILRQPEPYRSILLHLQLIIEKTIPALELKYKYKIPFYYLEGKPFCYLNQSKDYVDLGFWKAAYLTVHLAYMTTANRKMMKSLRYKTVAEINRQIVIDILQDAYSVKDKKFHK
ncbi:MAG TPA: DUF1801 domain-containing protein [Flavobacteriia bacterium]|nr:DUF1801 domain-containing protein [Flavobacteriia bacterium]